MNEGEQAPLIRKNFNENPGCSQNNQTKQNFLNYTDLSDLPEYSEQENIIYINPNNTISNRVGWYKIGSYLLIFLIFVLICLLIVCIYIFLNISKIEGFFLAAASFQLNKLSFSPTNSYPTQLLNSNHDFNINYEYSHILTSSEHESDVQNLNSLLDNPLSFPFIPLNVEGQLKFNYSNARNQGFSEFDSFIASVISRLVGGLVTSDTSTFKIFIDNTNLTTFNVPSGLKISSLKDNSVSPIKVPLLINMRESNPKSLIPWIKRYINGELETIPEIILKVLTDNLKMSSFHIFWKRYFFIPLGTIKIDESINLKSLLGSEKIPTIPKLVDIYNISILTNTQDENYGLNANALVDLQYNGDWFETNTLPDLDFHMAVPNCLNISKNVSESSKIIFASIHSNIFSIESRNDTITLFINVHIPPLNEMMLKRNCEEDNLAPLENFMKLIVDCLQGNENLDQDGLNNTAVYLVPDETASWKPIRIAAEHNYSFGLQKNELLKLSNNYNNESKIEVRDLELTDIKFSEGDSKKFPIEISADVSVLAILKVQCPKFGNVNESHSDGNDLFPIKIESLCPDVGLYFHDSKFGVLKEKDKLAAKSQLLSEPGSKEIVLKITSRIDNGPVRVVNQETFESMIRELMFKKHVTIKLKGYTDAWVNIDGLNRRNDFNASDFSLESDEYGIRISKIPVSGEFEFSGYGI